jgi:hypothetical protein
MKIMMLISNYAMVIDILTYNHGKVRISPDSPFKGVHYGKNSGSGIAD